MQELPKLHLLVLVVIGHVVVADQVRNARGWNRCLELVGLSDEPIGELSAVAHSLDPQPFSINPQVAPHCSAHTVKNVLAFIAVLVAEDGVRKFLAVTSGAAIIHIEHGVAVRRVDLILEVEAGTIFSVRSSMNHYDQWMLRRGGHADGLGEKSFHVESIVVA